MRVPTGCLTGFTLTTVVVPSRSGRSTIRRLRVMTTSEPPEASTAPATTRRPLPSAPRCRQPQQLGRDHRAGDGEQAGDLLGRAVDAGAVVLDEVALPLGSSPSSTCGAGVEPVVGQLLQHEAAELVLAARRPSAAEPSTVRNRLQSSRSNFKFGAAGELAKAGSGF